MKFRLSRLAAAALVIALLTLGIAGCRPRIPVRVPRPPPPVPIQVPNPQVVPPNPLVPPGGLAGGPTFTPNVPRFPGPTTIPGPGVPYGPYGPGMRGPRMPYDDLVIPGRTDPFGRRLPGTDPFAPPFARGGFPGASGPRILIVPEAAPRAATAAEARAALGKLARDLDEVHALATRKDWTTLGQRVRQELHRPDLPAELRLAVDALEPKGRQLEALTQLEAHVAAGKPIQLAALEAASLPAPARKAVEEAVCLERIQVSLTERWTRGADLARLEQDLTAFAVASRDAALTTRLRIDLARKAVLEGHPEAARKLLPPGHAADELALRDLRPAGPMEHFVGPPAPPIRPFGLAPEAPPGTRAVPHESARAGLPPLREEVAAAAKQARQRAAEQVRDQIDVTSHHLHLNLHQIHHFSRNAERLAREKDEDRKPGAGDGKPEEAVARILKRELTPTERILMQGMLSRGKQPAETAASLRELEAADPR